MDILLIGGFLGAGKTSFIKAMTHATGRQFVVVENEFGNINIDSQALRSGAPDMKVWELTEGCICCSMNMDFSMGISKENPLIPIRRGVPANTVPLTSVTEPVPDRSFTMT